MYKNTVEYRCEYCGTNNEYDKYLLDEYKKAGIPFKIKCPICHRTDTMKRVIIKEN